MRFPYLLSLPQSGLERLLAERAGAAGVEVRWSHRLASPRARRRRRGGDASTGSRRSPAATRVAHTEWADGRDAGLRAGVRDRRRRPSLARAARARHRRSTRPGPRRCSRSSSATPRSSGDEQRLVLREDSVNALWPLPDGRARWSMEVAAPEVSAADRFKGRLSTLLGERFFPQLDESRTRERCSPSAPPGSRAAPVSRLVDRGALRAAAGGVLRARPRSGWRATPRTSPGRRACRA